MTIRYPTTYHRIGDTWDRTQRYALPSGTWTPASTVKTSAGTLVQTFTATLTALSETDADGNTHVLNTVATATQTAAWPLATLICDTTFTDASATPVVRSAEAFNIAATAHLPPVLDEYATLAVIPGDLVALLRGEQGPAGATGATGDTGAAGAGVPTGGTTGQVLAKASNTDRDTEWVDLTGGSGGGATNLGYTASATNGVVTSDTGTDATIPAADATNAGLLTPAQFSKLAATSGTNTGDQDLSGYSLTSHNHTGTYDPAGTASSALSSHTAAGDPHPQYALESALGTAAAASTSDFTPAAHAGSGGTAHADAIASGAAGFMSGADKAKLDGVAAGAQVNPASTDAVPEGSTNLYHTAARVRAAILTGLSTATATVVTAAHTVLEALGFLQAQVNAKQDTLVSGTNIKTVNSTSLLGSGDITVGASIAPLVVEDANTIAQRNGVTAQNSYVYNTISGANYERLRIGWASNRVELRTEAGGTGSLRAMNLPGEIRLMPQSGNLGEYVSLSAVYRTFYVGSDSGQGVAIIGNGQKVSGIGTALTLSTTQNYGSASTITIQAADPTNNNLNGGNVVILGQNGGNVAGNNNSGGGVCLAGGTAAGSGTTGAVNLAYTGSAARGAVKCWGILTMDALLLPKPCTTATRPSWVNGATVFDTDLDKLLIGGVSGWEVVTSV